MPSARADRDGYDGLLADIESGARLHYARVDGDPDPDLALLQGDHLYARGLSRLAELGDLGATRELADAISLVAQAHASGDAGLAQAVWAAGRAAVLSGGTPELQAAKNLARAGDPGAAAALREATAAAAESRDTRDAAS